MSGTQAFFGRMRVSGPGQNLLRELAHDRGDGFRHVRHRIEILLVRQVHDERIETGTLLRLEDLRHRARVQRIRSQAIDRLGRQRDHLARREQAHGFARRRR